MKKLFFHVLMLLPIFISCKNTWDSEARDLFYQGCMESAVENGMDSLQAQSMCNCRLEKTMKKYPNFSEAMDHADDLMKDEGLKKCK
jgi:hypothetical protein